MVTTIQINGADSCLTIGRTAAVGELLKLLIQLDQDVNPAKPSPIGCRITGIRLTTDQENNYLMWYASGPVLNLDNGERIYAYSDEDGNGPGSLWVSSLEGNLYLLDPVV